MNRLQKTVLLAAFAASSAWAAEPVADKGESLDVLRQRLAERLGKGQVAVPVPVKGVTKSKAETARLGKKLEVKPATSGDTAAHLHWGYAGDAAPQHWAEIAPENRQCAAGSRQSPIDIRDGIKVELAQIEFDYRPSGFAVIDTGHTVQVNLAAGNVLQVMGRRFELVQFHFHRPSEERINGRQFDMVAHLVHKDAAGGLGVVAVLLERGPGDKPHALVQAIWNNLPLEKGVPLSAPGLLDVSLLLPEDRSYFTYMGSLTTPPCSEGVLWMVMRSPATLSAQQLAIFSKLYPMNARPLQAGAGRLIKESQ